jgi:hypothetical protein
MHTPPKSMLYLCPYCVGSFCMATVCSSFATKTGSRDAKPIIVSPQKNAGQSPDSAWEGATCRSLGSSSPTAAR